MQLSIVIPAKNEEANIARCIDSLFSWAGNSQEREIILVDSCSADKTVETASKYGIKIIQLKPDWPHSPAASRYIGSLFSCGDFIFFIDADMTLENGFIEKGVSLLTEDGKVAGVSGIAKEIYLKANVAMGEKANLYKSPDSVKEVNFLGGAALYRRKYLLGVGSFHPYLMAAEEIELGQRLRSRNYRLLSIPYPMITHYTAPVEEWTEFARKKKAHLFLGIGQAWRLAPSFGYFTETLIYYKEFTLFLFFILAELILTIDIFIRGKFHLFLPLPLLIILIYLLAKKRSLSKALTSLIKWLVLSIEIMRGFILKPKDARDYPRDPRIIKGDFSA